MPRKPAVAPAPKAAPRAQRTAAPAPARTSKSAVKNTPGAAAASAARALTGAPAKKPAAKKAAPKAAPKTAPKAAPKTARAVKAPVIERAPVEEARPVLVRDSFTMPEQEYAVLLEVKQACLRAGVDVKKSELLRIGVALLGQLDVTILQAVLAALPQLKTGRPPAKG